MKQEIMPIEVRDLTYRQGSKTIIDNVSFKVLPQERLAILGVNGSGKTSLIECMLDINKANSGEVLLGNNRLIRNISQIGVVWDQVELFPMLKVKEVLRYFSLLKGLKDIDHNLYNLLNLDAIKQQQMKYLSKGERKKVCIFIAMMNQPHYLFSDELSSDLDEQTLSILWSNYLAINKTIIFTTHKWHEAEKYATHLMFMYQGRLIMPPIEKKKIAQEYPFSYKVVTNQREIPSELSTIPHYYNEEKVVLCVGSETSKVAQSLTLLGESSVLPFNYLDLYNYLSFILR